MTAPHIVDPHGTLGEALTDASRDLIHTMLQRLINDSGTDARAGVACSVAPCVVAAKDVRHARSLSHEPREDVVRVARNREPGQKLSVIAKDFGISESCLTN